MLSPWGEAGDREGRPSTLECWGASAHTLPPEHRARGPDPTPSVQGWPGCTLAPSPLSLGVCLRLSGLTG